MTLGRNILWNLAGFIWLSLLLILVTPYMVAKLGLEAFGVWSVLTAFVGYLTMMDLGLGNAIIRFVAVEREQGDRVALAQFIRSGLSVQLGLGLIAATLFYVFSPLIAIDWLRVPASLSAETIAAFRISSIAVGLAFPVAVFAAVPAALHRFDLLAGRTLLLNTLQYISFVLVLAWGGGLLGIAVVNAAAVVAVFIYLAVVSVRLLPGLRLLPGWHAASIRELFRFGRFKFPAQISVSLLQQLDRIVLAGIVPLARVPYYAVPVRLAQRVSQVVEQIASPFYPAIAADLAGGREEVLRRRYADGTRIVVVLAGGAISVIGGLASPILAVWMGESFAREGTWPLRLLLLAYSASALATLPSVAADADGRPGIPAGALIAGALLHAGLLVWWIPSFKLNGAALAVLAGFLVPLLVGVPLIHRRVSPLPGFRELFGVVRGVVGAAMVAGLAAVFLARTPFSRSGVVALLSSLVAVSVLYGAGLILLGGLRVDDLRRCRGLLRGSTHASHRN